MDGARLSFWATKIELREEVPIVNGMPELGTQLKITWVDKFRTGIETPLIGMFLSLSFYLFQVCRKRSLKFFFD